MDEAQAHSPESKIEAIRAEIARVVIGQSDAVDLLLVALLCEGHALLEGMPGTAKTLLAQSFAASLTLDFGRAQFTPDLMPGDITGTNLFDFQKNEFHLTRGPIFTDILLADEINRAPPKTQSSLLQAMQERCVTIDGKTYELGDGFMVVATQNPIEQEGTYPLPEAQLDRFLVKIEIDYPSRQEELEMAALHGKRSGTSSARTATIERIADRDWLRQTRAQVDEVELAEDVLEYCVDLVRATREHVLLSVGASPRAINMLCSASRALAFLRGRDYVLPDDVQELCAPVLAHRILLAPGAELDGTSARQALSQVVEQIAVPR